MNLTGYLFTVLLLPPPKVIVGGDVSVQCPQSGLVADSPSRVPATTAGQYLFDELVTVHCARGEPSDGRPGRGWVRFFPRKWWASDGAPNLDGCASGEIMIFGFIPGSNRSVRLTIKDPESHAPSVKQRLAALLGVQAIANEPAYLGSLTMACGGTVCELCGVQLYFQAVGWLVDVHVSASVPVFGSGPVTLVSGDADESSFYPVMLRGFRTPAVAGWPVAADARRRLEPEESWIVTIVGSLNGDKLDTALGLRAHQHVVF